MLVSLAACSDDAILPGCRVSLHCALGLPRGALLSLSCVIHDYRMGTSQLCARADFVNPDHASDGLPS